MGVGKRKDHIRNGVETKWYSEKDTVRISIYLDPSVRVSLDPYFSVVDTSI